MQREKVQDRTLWYYHHMIHGCRKGIPKSYLLPRIDNEISLITCVQIVFWGISPEDNPFVVTYERIFGLTAFFFCLIFYFLYEIYCSVNTVIGVSNPFTYENKRIANSCLSLPLRSSHLVKNATQRKSACNLKKQWVSLRSGRGRLPVPIQKKIETMAGIDSSDPSNQKRGTRVVHRERRQQWGTPGYKRPQSRTNLRRILLRTHTNTYINISIRLRGVSPLYLSTSSPPRHYTIPRGRFK